MISNEEFSCRESNPKRVSAGQSPETKNLEKIFLSDEYSQELRGRQREYFESAAGKRDFWRKRNRYYHEEVLRLFKKLIPLPAESSAAEAGCSTGGLLSALKCKRSVGIDFSSNAVKTASEKYPEIAFIKADIEELEIKEKFDYVVCSDTLSSCVDVWRALRNLRKLCHEESRVIITNYNYLWEPVLRAAEVLGLKAKQPLQNWLMIQDVKNLVKLSGFEIIITGQDILIPFYVPVLSGFINKYLAKISVFKYFCLMQYIIARPEKSTCIRTDLTHMVSVIIPVLNESGNIAPLAARIPRMGKITELVFVDGGSSDGTLEQIEKIISSAAGGFQIKLVHQGGKFGKADAMRKGFAAADGDIFIILDGDLSVAPEDLPKFYLALAEGYGEFINGSRLNYPMETQAMRYLNNIANHFFGRVFTWLLGQPIRDTLCGTKAISKENYRRIQAQRGYFGEFDPFGDFDLLFGAARLLLKTVEIPIRYRNRSYGETKISRFVHGWLLLKMCFVAFRKLKFS